MRPSLPLKPVWSVLVAPALLLLAVLVYGFQPRPLLAQSCTTTITGKVYSPNGTDPLPNILVYVPTTAVQPLPQGLSSCAAASQLVSGNPLVSTTTAADGSFTLTSPGLAGTQTLVIQAGKWRRQYTGVVIPACQTTVAPSLAMPQNQSQGDIPQIAISTGSSDAIECVLRKIGISDSEFTAAGGTGRISLFAGSESPGVTSDASGTKLPSETTLVSSPSTLNNFDLSIFACQGTPTNPAAMNTTNQQNVVDYANIGGRVFATHYSYVWLNNSTIFASTANWVNDTTISSSTTVPIDATIDQSYAEGVVLADWLFDIGATPVKGQLPLYVTKRDQTGINPPAQSWATLNDPAVGNPVMQFTFDTPIEDSSVPTVAAAFTNSPAKFAPGDEADTVLINVTDTSTTSAADNSLNLKLTLPTGITAASLAGVGNTGWVCSVNTLTCNRTTALAAGTSDVVRLVVSIASNAPLGNSILNVTLAGGGLSNTNQCGRVLFNEYHVETVSTSSKVFPQECEATPMSPQEKFLEFSLYNLSNFVAPVTADTLDIQTTPTLTWSAPAAIYYGTALSATQLDATSTAPGTFTYSPAAGTVLPVGSNPLSATFTPTDATSYTTATASTTLSVLPDTTLSTLSASTASAASGSTVTLTDSVVANAAAPTGTVNFYDGTLLLGTATLTASTGDTAVATLSTSQLASGPHTITAVYAATTNFGATTSNAVTVNVLGTSTTAITGLVSPIDYGQTLGQTAFVNVTGSSTGGTITVYINGTAVCVLPVAPGLTNACPPATGANEPAGTYSLYAVFSGDPLFSGSTSPTYTVQVLPDSTTTTLTSSLNPAYLGNSVAFTATVTAPYAAPTGSVTFSDGSTQLGVVNLAAAPAGALSATATYSTTALAVGSQNITATYSATPDFNASATTSPLVEVVQPPLPLGGSPGYILTVTPTTVNAPVGANTPIAINIQEVNGYSQPVTLSCAGLTSEATCTFTQATVPGGGGTTTLYITPAAPHACGSNNPQFVASGRTNGMIWLSGLGLCLLLSRRRRLLRGLTLALMLCLLPILNGCGDSTCTDFGTKPGTYSFTITATPATTATGSNEGVQSQTVTYTATL